MCDVINAVSLAWQTFRARCTSNKILKASSFNSGINRQDSSGKYSKWNYVKSRHNMYRSIHKQSKVHKHVTCKKITVNIKHSKTCHTVRQTNITLTHEWSNMQNRKHGIERFEQTMQFPTTADKPVNRRWHVTVMTYYVDSTMDYGSTVPTLVDTVHVYAVLFDVLVVTGPSAAASPAQTEQRFTCIHSSLYYYKIEYRKWQSTKKKPTTQSVRHRK